MSKVTIQELLDEIDQNPEYEWEIARDILPLFNRFLNERDFQFEVTEVMEGNVRCRIKKMPKPSSTQ